MTNQKDDSSLLMSLCALVCGTLLGAIAGMLLAPRSGRESRARIGAYWRNCNTKLLLKKDATRDSASKLADTLSRVAHESQQALKEMQEKVSPNNNAKNGKKS
jgi:gas vesicle protein